MRKELVLSSKDRTMANVHINIGSNQNRRKNMSAAIQALELAFTDLKISSVFESPAEAKAYFNKLCERRTDYPASVVLTERILVRKKFRIDKNWQGDRFITNEDLG